MRVESTLLKIEMINKHKENMMGILSRMSDVVQANVNALLDKAENPEKMLQVIIQDFEQVLADARVGAAHNIAAKKSIQRNLSMQQKRVDAWLDKAQLAMSKNREALARQALQQKLLAEKECEQFEVQLHEIELLIEQHSADIGRVQEKLAEAKKRQRIYVQKHHILESRQALRIQDEQSFAQTSVKFDQFEARIDRLEAELESYELLETDLQSQFAAMEREEKIERELASIRNKVA